MLKGATPRNLNCPRKSPTSVLMGVPEQAHLQHA